MQRPSKPLHDQDVLENILALAQGQRAGSKYRPASRIATKADAQARTVTDAAASARRSSPAPRVPGAPSAPVMPGVPGGVASAGLLAVPLWLTARH
jgi:hypothetical protein